MAWPGMANRSRVARASVHFRKDMHLLDSSGFGYFLCKLIREWKRSPPAHKQSDPAPRRVPGLYKPINLYSPISCRVSSAPLGAPGPLRGTFLLTARTPLPVGPDRWRVLQVDRSVGAPALTALPYIFSPKLRISLSAHTTPYQSACVGPGLVAPLYVGGAGCPMGQTHTRFRGPIRDF